MADSGSTAFNQHLSLVTRYEYDLENRLRLVIDPKGDTTRYYYDAAGRVRYKYHPDLGTTSYAYDDLGNVRFSQTEEQARTHKLSFSKYDDLNRLTLTGEAILSGESLPDTSIPRGTSVSLDRLTDRFDPTVLHDSAGSILTASKSLWQTPASTTPKFFHPATLDSVTICTLLADTLLGETTPPPAPYLRHPVGFWEPVTSPGASRNRFENVAAFPHFPRMGVAYDALPERSGTVWERLPAWDQWDSLAPGGVIRNLKGREAAVAYREHGGEPFHFAVMSYDERGRVEALLHYTENLGFDAVWYTYNSSNQVTSVRVIDRLRQFTTYYGYDWNGRVDTVWTHLSGLGTGLGVVAAHRPAVDTTRDYPADIVYGYTPAGQVATMRYGSVGVLVQYAYNHRKWLDSMVATGTGPLFIQALMYDASGQVVSQTWQHLTAGRTTHWYDYDAVNRLVRWQTASDTTYYTYDEKGNRTNEQSYPSAMTTTSLYGDTVASDRVTETNTWAGAENRISYYGYDPNGAVTGIKHTSNLHLPDKDSLEYSWRGLTRRYLHYDHNGSGAVTSNEDWRYRYSAGGEREQKRLYWQQDSAHRIMDHKSWVYYLLGGKKEQLAVYHGQETDTSLLCIGQDGAEVYMYPTEYLSYGIGGTASIKQTPGQAKEFRIADHLGSLRVALTTLSSAGYDYDPWGRVLAGVLQGKGFVDKRRDRENGLICMGVRLYDGGTFMSPDPLWENDRGWGPYHYAHANPLALRDPSGMGDYLDNDGHLIGTDGQKDDKIYSTTEELYNQFADAGDFKGLQEARGTELWPGHDVRAEIEELVTKPARLPINNKEFGGVTFEMNDGFESFAPSKPGQDINTGSPEQARIDIAAALSNANSVGVAERTVHTHPNGYSVGPSPTDRAEQQKLRDSGAVKANGIVISMTRDARVFFYDGKGVTASVPLSVFLSK